MAKSNFRAILITGATGNVGRELTKLLSARRVSYRAMIRSGKGAQGFPSFEGAEVAVGDFEDARSLARAFEGVERVFLLTNSSERAEIQQCTLVEAAGHAGVKHIVKLSQWAASAESPVRFLRYHAAVERKIRESAMAYTFLRPNLFMQGLLAFREAIVGQGRFFAAVGDARISAVDVRDVASAAAAALLEKGHEGRIYDLTGPEALSHGDMARGLSQATGRPIEFVDIPPESMRQTLLQVGLPVWQAEGLVEDYAHYARGEAAEIAKGVQDATGRPPRSFADFAADYAQAFCAPASHKKSAAGEK